MRFNRLDLNLLVAFHTLARERSVSRAAERLNISQSGMSSALARLREFFNDDLFVQVGRGMALTPLAENLAGQVSDLLQRVQGLIDTQPVFDPRAIRRTVRIVASDYTVGVLLAPLIRGLRQDAPGLTLDISPPGSRSQLQLSQGDVDFLIFPSDFMDEVHPRQQLFSDPYVCCVWSGNDRVGDGLTLEEFLAMGHVVVRFGAERTYTYEQRAFVRAGLTRNEVVSAPSFNALLPMLVGTDLVATVPLRLARLYDRILPLRLLPPPLEMPPLPETLQWCRAFAGDPTLCWVRNRIIEMAMQAQQTDGRLSGGTSECAA